MSRTNDGHGRRGYGRGPDSRIVGQRVEPEQRTEGPPEFVAADADRDVARFRAERLIRQQRAVGRAERTGDDAVRDVGADHPDRIPS